MKLSNRLEMLISFVENTETAADIGTDHAHVPVELVRRGIVKRAYAMDVRKGPLSRAKEHIAAAGLGAQIETRLSDGLDKLKAGEAHAVIIAGMGGELMIHILEAGSHILDSVDQWVLSPHSEIPKVREWLCRHGFPIVKEAMVYEDGKYYTILDVRKQGSGVLDAENDFRYGMYQKKEKNPVFWDYLKEEERKLTVIRENLSVQAEHSEKAKESLLEVEKKLAANREVQHEMQGDH